MKDDLFRATVRKYMELRHVRTLEQLRAHTTIGSSTTFRKYFKDPELMPLGTWGQIMTSLNVPYEEQFNILKGKD